MSLNPRAPKKLISGKKVSPFLPDCGGRNGLCDYWLWLLCGGGAALLAHFQGNALAAGINGGKRAGAIVHQPKRDAGTRDHIANLFNTSDAG